MSQLRIIGGSFRGRKISFTPLDGLRPTPNRVRETLFNWLAPVITDAKCLDLFAGSGALGFEALSRGASLVTFVDKSRKVIEKLKENAALLHITNIGFLVAEIPKFLKKIAIESQQNNIDYDIVFLDPPFYKNLVEITCQKLEENNLLAKNALIYLETEIKIDVEKSVPKNWMQLQNKKSGHVKYSLFQRKS
jgi:16S rRNA (guanine966-N2)-methyltransferase